jgi:hypothetical protein
MRYPDLDARQRMDAASLQGMVERLLVGSRDGQPKWVYEAGGVAAVHEVTRDVKVIGHVMGVLQARTEHEHPYYEPAVVLLELAGGDPEVAAQTLAWLRQRKERDQRPQTRFTAPGQQD